MKKVLITYAVREEFVPLTATGCEVNYLYTGIGKTKSATRLTESICRNKPDIVINVGTAGTLNHQIGDVFVANRFVDRDYEHIKLPGVEYEIDAFSLLEGLPRLKDWLEQHARQGTCSTGDTFITEATYNYGDVIEMEAYAQAYVCQEFNVPFLSVKYVTDVIGNNSVAQWESKLDDARKGLQLWFEENDVFALLGA